MGICKLTMINISKWQGALPPVGDNVCLSISRGPLYKVAEVLACFEKGTELHLLRKSSKDLADLDLSSKELKELAKENFMNISLRLYKNSSWCKFLGNWAASDAYNLNYQYFDHRKTLNARQKNIDNSYYFKFFIKSDGCDLGIVSIHRHDTIRK